MKETKVNRQYKDRLFRLIFKEKESLLELYNAVNESAYTDPEALTITTLEDVLYMTMKNDASFIVGDVMNLYEHQSSFNPNMPLRGFFYFAELYRNYVEERGLDLYGSRRIHLPLPRYVVFYNGKREEPDRMELKLSDSFSGSSGEDFGIEVKAVMVNINLGHNEELMERCRKLKEYAGFIAAIREEVSGGASLEAAAGRVIDRCLKEGILTQSLSRYRTEVINMILEEYDEQRHIENEKSLSREEGIAKVNLLNQRLLQDKRFSDLERAASDRDFQKQLLQEYGIASY